MDLLIEAAARLRDAGATTTSRWTSTGRSTTAHFPHLIRKLGLSDARPALGRPAAGASCSELYAEYDVFAFPTRDASRSAWPRWRPRRGAACR